MKLGAFYDVLLEQAIHQKQGINAYIVFMDTAKGY